MNKSIVGTGAIAATAILLAASAAISGTPAQPGAGKSRTQATMTFADLERRAIALGIRPTELKIEHRIAKIEGRDAQTRKVEVTIDARSGQVLNREFDD